MLARLPLPSFLQVTPRIMGFSSFYFPSGQWHPFGPCSLSLLFFQQLLVLTALCDSGRASGAHCCHGGSGLASVAGGGGGTSLSWNFSSSWLFWAWHVLPDFSPCGSELNGQPSSPSCILQAPKLMSAINTGMSGVRDIGGSGHRELGLTARSHLWVHRGYARPSHLLCWVLSSQLSAPACPALQG